MPTEISIRAMTLHAVEVAFSGVAWFVAVMWLSSISQHPLGLILVVVTVMLVMVATLLLLAISIAIDDPQWRQLRVDALLGIEPIRRGRQHKHELKETHHQGWRRWQNV
jgi:hypothetical protein